MKEIEITLGELHEFFKLYPEEKGNLLIEGKDGWFPIDESAITAPNSKYYIIKTENGNIAKCSPEHLFYNGDYIKCRNLKIGKSILTKTGYSKITSLKLSDGSMDLYDIQVRHSKNYYGNNILSHNSSISQVIGFALYGKVDGKKLGEIPNRINGHAWVGIEFENNGRVISVQRGLEPSLFELYIDGVKYDQAGNKNIQDYLADDLIGIPYYVFNNTISLSINDFKSFIKMSPQDKRAIVDKIFGFHILNQMRETLKSETKRIKEKLDNLSGNIAATVKGLERSNKEMEDLLVEVEKESGEESAKLNETLESLKKLQTLHSIKVDEFKVDETNLKSLVSDATKNLIEVRASHDELTRRLKLYESDKCPTCESSLDGEFHESLKESITLDKNEKKSKLEETEALLMDLRNSEASLVVKKKEITEKGSKIENKIREILFSIKHLESKNNKSQVTSLERIIRGLEDDKENFDSEVFKTAEKNNWIKTLDDILGERGVKQMAIKTILPSLNSEIMDLLELLHLDYQVIFDEEFKATVYHMGMEIPIPTLSTGEMKKVDFVVLIAIMKLMKLKFSSINLLFLDELFSSVDPDGVGSILRILQKNSRDMGLNIFVVNHAPMPHEIFDWKLDIKKTNNFSTINREQF
jgi:DNA repair exonuclease SbcCD ATPase subunit